MTKYLAALDQGTTSSRCILFDRVGAIKSMAQTELRQIYPKPGWVEHDPLEIWSSQYAMLAEAMTKSGVKSSEIAAIGITNQRETVVVWNRHTGEPVYNAIVWQCLRSAGYCTSLVKRGLEGIIREKTGLVVDAYFSGPKLRWILDNVENARRDAGNGDLLFGTVDSWLVWKLTQGKVHATDVSNASRTMLFNIHTLDWDDELLEAMEIPRAMLPEVVSSSQRYGTVASDLIGGEIPVASMIGDQQAALFGHGCHEPGTVKNTYGTGCFTLMNTGGKAVQSRNRLLSTIAWGIDGKVEYALEGSIFVAGSAVQWLRDGLGVLSDARSAEALATSVDDSGGIYVVPAFAGLGAPHWDQHARGIIVGITGGVKREHLIRATLEAIAYQTSDVIRAMEADAGLKLKSLRVDGGASTNNFLMQFQADILNLELARPLVTEITALGAAYLAGLAVGFYDSKEDIRRSVPVDRVFAPHMAETKRRELLSGWDEAVRRSLGWTGKEE